MGNERPEIEILRISVDRHTSSDLLRPTAVVKEAICWYSAAPFGVEGPDTLPESFLLGTSNCLNFRVLDFTWLKLSAFLLCNSTVVYETINPRVNSRESFQLEKRSGFRRHDWLSFPVIIIVRSSSR